MSAFALLSDFVPGFTSRALPRALGAAGVALVLAGCAQFSPQATSTEAASPATADRWQAPLPHSGELGDLQRWWQQFKDPLLVRLIDAAQAASPTLADARSRIEQARATRVAGGAALGPTLDASASASRGRFDLISPLASSAQAGLQASWELDLFGAARNGRDAAQARLEGAQASWHDARVSVAAEVAQAYLSLRACEAQLAQSRIDTTSRAETARLTDLAARAGFQAPATAALSRASAAQANALLTQQRARCDLDVKTLVALTAVPEPTLREQLAAGTAVLPAPAQLAVGTVPARVLAQRPDLFAAEREVAAASSETAQTQALRYPRISLAGNIGPAHLESAGVSSSGTLWSFGPVTVSLPLFDGGVRRANVDAARARFDAAALRYAASLRTAVREVEEALVALQSTADRSADAQTAADGFELSLRATEARFKGGLGSLFELEDARRSAISAQTALIDLQRERVAAWISLYRALGGGWSAGDPAVASSARAPS
jgi:NodT family efflux transporter outer membrane factor (OMF) lipoprotein